MRNIIALCVSVLCFGLCAETNNVKSLFREASKATSTTNLDRGIDTLLFLNHINYVVETLNSYQNTLVLDQEYKTISPGNINMNRIPNEAIRNHIVKLLDAIQAMKKNEKEFEREKSKLERARINARRDIWMKFAQNALSSGVEGAVQGGAKPKMVALGAGKAVLGEAISSYAEFERAKREIQEQGLSNVFAYADTKEDTMHKAYKNLLALQYKFGAAKERTESSLETDDGFTIPDKFRLSGENAKNLVNALKNDDLDNVYKELRNYKRSPAYAFFPTFWYYYAVIAYKTKHLQDALVACRHFEEINRGLFRSDPMAAAVAMTEICISIEQKNIEAQRVRALLEVIMKNDRECNNSDWEYFCASIYSQVLNDQAMACEILAAMIARLERQNKANLVQYSDLLKEKEKEIEKEKDKDKRLELRANFFKEKPVPEDSDLARARMLYRDILAQNKDPLTMEYLRGVCLKNTTASIEKLYYVGSMKADSLWNIARKDIERLSLRYERYGKKSGEFVFEIPLTWFILGDMNISMDLYQGSNKVDTIEETVKKRSVTNGIKEYDVVSIKIPCAPDKLNGKDSFAVKLPHKSWPVQILYMPKICYDIDQNLSNSRVVGFVPSKVEFLGEIRQLVAPDADEIKDAILKWPLEQDWKRYFFLHKDKIQVGQDGVKEIVTKDKSFIVHYENPAQQHRTLQLKVLLFNQYGAKFCTLSFEVELAPNSNGEAVLYFPDEMKDCAQPAYCALEVKNYQTMSNKFADKWNAWWSDEEEKEEKKPEVCEPNQINPKEGD